MSDGVDVAPARSWVPELRERHARVREIAAGAGCDALLVFGSPQHDQTFRWLTDFAPVMGDAWLLLGERDTALLQFGWQVDEGRARSGIERWDAAQDTTPLVIEAVRETRVRRVAVAGLERLPTRTHAALLLAVPGCELVDVGEPVAVLRRRKSPREIEAIRAACAATDEMLGAARAAARPGASEREVAARASVVALELGGALAFETVVIAGVEASAPIRRPTERTLRAGDTVMVDVGAAINGYQGDAARTFVLGGATRIQREAWDVVRRAHAAALERARPGVPCLELERAAAAVVAAAGYALPHRIGHGIGLATSFEWPSLDRDTACLEPNMTICIEPAVCAPGIGCMKLEDDVLITDDGCELLTTSHSALEVVA